MSTTGPDQWQVLSPYLDEGLALSEEERSVWLSTVRAQSPEVAAQLEALFREHHALSEEGFLEKESVALPSATGLAGQTLGVYKLVSQIGQGGMGTVWLAERSDGRFERRVAVKVLNLGLMGKSGEERFRREGRILALLVHPNIAELIDAGVSQAGQPFLVLEHIEGGHIDRYCDEHRLSVRARIRLFLDVLRAVEQAHANLIVHRDLKPSNVLVRNDGQVKLLDFGIAKLQDAEGQTGEAAALTGEGGRVLTPEYAAPEQLLSEPVTTATDIYALGVLLYVLLTGQHPAGKGPHTAAGLVDAIVRSEPKRPSDKVVPTASNLEETTEDAAQRGTTPERLRRLLSGDLDTIVGKALKKDPAERYSSVTALADDLRRYLRSEPISARPDTISYRAAKFVRRNRTAVALAVLAAVVMTAGIVGILIQTRNARAERDFALRQLVRAEATIDFNEFLLSDAAPSGKPFTVNELLGRAEDILARQHTDDASRVELMVIIGDQYSTQDEDAKARRILEEAYALSRRGRESVVRAEAACSLAGAMARDGEMARAEAMIQEGLRELPAGAQYDEGRVFCLRRGSEVAQERGDAREGIERMEQVKEMLKHSPLDSDTLQLHTSIELAEAYRMAGQNQLASSTFEKAAALLEPLGRSTTQTAVVVFNDWALALDKLGRPLEAEKLFRRAIDISRAGQTEETVSPILLNNYGRTLYALGRLDEAADYAERAYAQAQRAGNQTGIRTSLLARASIYIERRDFTRAQAMLAELEPILRRSFSPDNFWFGALASAQSQLAAKKGNFETALPLADQAVAIIEAASKAGRTGSDYLPIALVRRSTIELDMGRPAQAADDARQALTLLQAASPQGAFSSMTGHAYLNLGRALQAQGKLDDARIAFSSAAEHLENTVGADHPDTRKAIQLAKSAT